MLVDFFPLPGEAMEAQMWKRLNSNSKLICVEQNSSPALLTPLWTQSAVGPAAGSDSKANFIPKDFRSSWSKTRWDKTGQKTVSQDRQWYWTSHSIQQIFTESLLTARPCAGCLGYIHEDNRRDRMGSHGNFSLTMGRGHAKNEVFTTLLSHPLLFLSWFCVFTYRKLWVVLDLPPGFIFCSSWQHWPPTPTLTRLCSLPADRQGWWMVPHDCFRLVLAVVSDGC